MLCTPGRVYTTKTIFTTIKTILIIIIHKNYEYYCCTALSGESTLLEVYKLNTHKNSTPLDSVDKPLIVIDTNTAINLYTLSSERASTRASVRALV